MRSHPLRVLSLAALACAPALAQAPAELPELRIEPGAVLALGAAATIAVYAKLPPGTEQALLLTPQIEGEAVRVVRGRLSRADAQLAPNGELRFGVPVLARRAGTALIHVELLTYHCAAGRCRARHTYASAPVHVGGS